MCERFCNSKIVVFLLTGVKFQYIVLIYNDMTRESINKGDCGPRSGEG
jgi:hypothetical protein